MNTPNYSGFQSEILVVQLVAYNVGKKDPTPPTLEPHPNDIKLIESESIRKKRQKIKTPAAASQNKTIKLDHYLTINQENKQ